MEGEKKRELAALREAGLARDPNWKPWRDPAFTERLYREEYAPGSAGQNGAHTPGKALARWTGTSDADGETLLWCGVPVIDFEVGGVGAPYIARRLNAGELALEALKKAKAALNGAPNSIELHRVINTAIAAATGEEG
ncbi:hypothetical protein ACXIUS_28920 [Bosea thiooxidans]